MYLVRDLVLTVLNL